MGFCPSVLVVQNEAILKGTLAIKSSSEGRLRVCLRDHAFTVPNGKLSLLPKVTNPGLALILTHGTRAIVLTLPASRGTFIVPIPTRHIFFLVFSNFLVIASHTDQFVTLFMDQ